MPKNKKISIKPKKEVKFSAKKKERKIKFTLKNFFIVFFVILGLAFITIFGVALAFNTKFYPKTKVGGIEISSLSLEDAAKKLKEKTDEFKKGELLVVCGEKEKRIKIEELKPEFKIEETLQKLFSLGHPKSFKEVVLQFPEIIKILLFHQNMPLLVIIKEEGKIEEINGVISTSPKDAKFEIKDNKLEIIPEENGSGVETKELKDAIVYNFSLLKKEVVFSPKMLKPSITKEVLEGMKPKVEEILLKAPLKLVYKGEIKYSLSKEEILKLLGFEKENGGKIKFAINEDGKKEIFEKISSEINERGQNIKLRLGSGGIEVIEKEKMGLYLDEDDLAQKIISFFNAPQDKIEISFLRKLPPVNSSNYKNFKFTDLLGKGESYFYGSPPNRVNNIKVGAEKLNGLVIEKDAVFSLGEALGDISREAGYVEGLVIKNNKTVSELGGGLCQVATTIFRAAINSGLEVIERHPHGYRVPYYEPPVGMDAAIYYPSIDVKFKNDTLEPILIQTKIEGYYLAFYFYGENDGRRVYISSPQVYNLVPPPSEPLYIDDPTLPKGTEIVVDSAHWGSDASFEYKVYKEGKLIFEKVFKSHYVPWPANIRRGTKE